MSFIGNANNIWIDIFGGPGGGGPPGGVPSWVLRADGIPATLDIDFTTGALWNGGVGNVPPWTLLAGTANNYIPPILDIDFVNDQASVIDYTNIAALLTCTRASTGFYTNAGGFLTSVGNNTLRVGDLGLLVEESRINLCLQSQTFDNASWTATNLSVTANSTAAPDGTTTADSFVENAVNGVHALTQSITVVTATAYTLSCMVQAGTRTQFNLLFGAGGFGGVVGAYFTLTGAGAVQSTVGGATATIKALANGWYLCTTTATSTASAASTISVGPSVAASNSYLGVNATTACICWGAQLEAGAFPTSYIPTTTVSVTRAADSVFFNSFSWYNSGAMTIYVAGSYINSPSSVNDQGLFGIVDGINNVDVDRFATSTHFAFRGTGLNVDTGLLATTSPFKLATAFAIGDTALTVGGAAPFTSALLSAMPVTITNIYLCDKTTIAPMNGLMTRFSAWNTRRSNAALQAVTT